MKIQSIKKLILIVASMAISTSVFGQRSVMVHSNTSVLLYPTNLWSANASAARSGFGLTATWLTNTNVTNFRSDIGLVLLALTNTNVTNFRHDIGLGVSNSVLFNTLTVTNFKVTQSATNQSLRVIADLTFDAGGSIQMPDGYGISFAGEAGPRTRTNLSLGWSALTNTNASNFRSAIDIGWSALTNTNAASFRTAIGLGETNSVTNGSVTAQTFNVTAGGGIVLQSVLSNDASFRTNIRLGLAALTNTNTTNFRSAIGLGWLPLTNTNAANFRSDIGLGWSALTNTNADNFRSGIGLGWSALTNTNAVNFRTAIELGATWLTNTNSPLFPDNGNGGRVEWKVEDENNAGEVFGVYITPGQGTAAIGTIFGPNIYSEWFSASTYSGPITVSRPFDFSNNTNKAVSRTNLGIPLTALTNTSNTTFQQAIFTTNDAPTNTANINAINFNTAISWMAVDIVTNGTTNTFHVPLFK